MIVTETQVTRVEEEKTQPKGYFRTKIVWKNAIGFLLLHLAAAYGTYLGFTQAKTLTLLWTIFLMFLAGFSVTAGAHRLYSHKSYKATPGLRAFLIFGQTIAGQNCMWVWVRDHRQHHKYSDTDADPHNANRGFFFSHIGWLMMKKHPEVIAKGKTIDMSDLEADPMVMFQKEHYKKLYIVFALLLPSYIPVWLWGEEPWLGFMVAYLARFVVGVNMTWMVNSWAHAFGTKPYTKDILPVESRLVGHLALGEGWHNYHHSFPWDYRAAEGGTEPNFTSTALDWMAKRGWVTDRRTASPEVIKSRVVKRGDGTHPAWGFTTTSEYY